MMYLDTNIILYAVERHPTYGNACKRIMHAIERGRLKVGASVFVLLEVMGGLQKLNRSPRSARRQTPLFSIQENLDALLSLPIVWFEMSIATVDRVCTHMDTIHTADALHIATAELHDIREILSADKDFDRVSSLRRIDPLMFQHSQLRLTPTMPKFMTMFLQWVLQERGKLSENDAAQIGARIANMLKKRGNEKYSRIAYLDAKTQQFKWA